MKYLAEQNATIGNLRNRASGLSVISAFIVTFASTVGLLGRDAASAFPWPVSIALWAVVTVQLTLVMAIMWPVTVFYGPDLRDMLNADRWNAGRRAIDEPSVRALFERIQGNGRKVYKFKVLYVAAVTCLFVEVSIILGTVVAKG